MALQATQTVNSPPVFPAADHSAAAAAFEHLAESAQGVVTKHIDLALLEGREVASQTLERAAWGIAGTLVATAAWLSLTLSLIQMILPDVGPAAQLATFALVNGIAATAILAYASRSGSPAARRPAKASVEAQPASIANRNDDRARGKT